MANAIRTDLAATGHASRSALITGVGGQDGAYLARELLQRGFRVFGTSRRGGAASEQWRLVALGIAEQDSFELCALDLGDAGACADLLQKTQAELLFHLAGQSKVAVSFSDPIGTLKINAMGTLHLLEAARGLARPPRFVLAATAEMFGQAEQAPQSEATPFRPQSPYGTSKLCAHWLLANYRQGFGLHASSAILFNHESPLRDAAFVTRKISLAAARIARGLDSEVALGNLDARRDFGYAPEYVAALLAMTEQAAGDDYVLASGRSTSVREFATAAFAAVGIDLDWQGQGVAERGVDRANGALRVRVDPQFFRPTDPAELVGDASKARAKLGFDPRTDVGELCRIMVAAELAGLAA